MNLKTPWQKYTFVAVDLETSGKYPIESEICEIGAVKWANGQVIGEFSTLIKPSHQMGEEVIKIHNISNEMVADAPVIDEKLQEFNDFIQGATVIAHHAPFDLGFLSIDYERMKIPFPEGPVVCSSLLSRNVITDSPNHRLQTLIKHLGINGGSAHRALDDARACLEVALKCFEKLGDVNLLDILKAQKEKIYWTDYSIKGLANQKGLDAVIEGCIKKVPIKIIYQGGSRPGKARIVYPKGIVRNPYGDFLAACDEEEGPVKRFYINRIDESSMA